LDFELPTKYVKDTFVGFVLPNEKKDEEDKKDGKSVFFETLIEELKTNVQEKSFQDIFEAVKEKLKDRVPIDSIDDFDEKPIHLFKKERLVNFNCSCSFPATITGCGNQLVELIVNFLKTQFWLS
jgi:hypothetical protein